MFHKSICPECQSDNVTAMKFGAMHAHRCWGCGHTWQTSANDNRKKKK